MADPRSPKSPRKGKVISLRVNFLNDTVHAFQVPVKAVGLLLWDAVVSHLQLLESDYFGLEYTNHYEDESWLDNNKQILKQLPSADTPLRFGVKFYMPDPSMLEEEITRYFFALQVRRDLLLGELHCSENTAALLASYIVQGEIGDFLVDEYRDISYLSSFKFVPQRQQTVEMLQKVMEYHRQHVGESPSEADSNLLDTARKVEMYGIKFHPAKDHEGVSLNLAVAHMGVLVFQGMTKINTFSWAKVRKLSFKRKKFLIKLHPESYGYYKDTVEFFFDTRDRCKYFWKKCIEHHSFFRCQTIKKMPRNKTRVVSRGSSFRYSGRTQKELQEYVRENIVKRPIIERSVSGRISSRSTSVTPKISAKPSVHNSSDLHNSTASSGSHILETSSSGLPPIPPTRLETAEIHSDSSMSGSRSLGSPRLEHGLSADSEGGEFINQPVDTAAVDARLPHSDSPDHLHTNNVSATSTPRLSTSGLQAKDRKFSAPVFRSDEEKPDWGDHRLSRTAEVENIPEIVEEEKNDENINSPSRKSLTRSASATPCESFRYDFDDLPPPPPPPPADVEEDEGRDRMMDLRDDDEEDEDEEGAQRKYLDVPSRNPAADISVSSAGFPSNMSNISSGLDLEEDTKRRSKHRPADTGYYIVKELLMTERTYKKDLEVLVVWFRQAISGDADALTALGKLIFSILDPIYDFHCILLKEIEQRLSLWEGKASVPMNGDGHCIGDLMLQTVNSIEQLYQPFLETQESMLLELDQRIKGSKLFEELFKEFESQKVCYLPLNTFFLKPGQRLLHYKLVLERLVKHYSPTHTDSSDCQAALEKVKDITNTYKFKLHRLENLQKLMELQRDLLGLENLVSVDREFLREGCLQKYSRKGYQQRMFFLFSDMLVYTSRSASSLLQFKVHGQLPVRGMTIEETEQSKVAVPNTFAIYSGSRCILVAASSEEEKAKWIEDINNAVQAAAHRPEAECPHYPTLKSSSSAENVDISGNNDGERSTEKLIQHRANTTMHVCWHRNTSVSIYDHERALKNQLSGYLLRKFKTSNGWQKLWVVFTNFCLFFYKTYQDDFPLASLPLLGYAVNQPEPEDRINKDNVFKLQFKNHVYFFRAESEYTYSRWMEVISLATSSARRTRLFSRMTSTLES
ncbi:FERM, ARHGEF and pleckstrin domain-containing protein 2-like isoform X2 [Pomacea canaliculata]|uniref:FERM, ARHGEF and pleckstrin domain-containing protein 2-like isoform X2 n=1 Tax=Pomacea canaliculata TaxID=400727 RepID=UPI000D72D0E7|nr:FERM, ARHGEF and pleckstrin domain-containing protein 2-like isoform X2 [Pomacea canaliculata]